MGRHLDASLKGSITMKEYDPASSDLLESFKKWSDENFGSAALAFKALDDDGGGSISCLEFRKACRSLNWSGDASLLFNCLDPGGLTSLDLDRSFSNSIGAKRGLSLKDVAFLDTWVTALTVAERKALEDETWAEVERARPLARKKIPRMRKSCTTPSLSGGGSRAPSASMRSSSTTAMGQSWPALGTSPSMRPGSTGVLRKPTSQSKRWRSNSGCTDLGASAGSTGLKNGALLPDEWPASAVSRNAGSHEVLLPAL